ncbi:MAG: class I SAM-dependent methyltransferase [Bacteroidales bacterium]
MSKNKVFDHNFRKYESWFEKNKYAYRSELNAVRSLLPSSGRGIEIGIGSGLFAKPLSINEGIDPSGKMRKIAESRGLKTKHGVAENIPYDDNTFDYALMVTTICFVDKPDASIQEIKRILKPGGYLITGFIDKDSPIGKMYLQHQSDSLFYREAQFYNTSMIVGYCQKHGFTEFRYVQTLFHDLTEITKEEPVLEGYGEGSFVVIRCRLA